jgi:hypothetical protein
LAASSFSQHTAPTVALGIADRVWTVGDASKLWILVMSLCAAGILVSYVRARLLIGNARKSAESYRIAQIRRADLIARSCFVFLGVVAMILWP